MNDIVALLILMTPMFAVLGAMFLIAAIATLSIKFSQTCPKCGKQTLERHFHGYHEEKSILRCIDPNCGWKSR